MKKLLYPSLVWASLLLLAVPGTQAQPTPAADRSLIVTEATAEVSGQNDSAAVSIAVVTAGVNLEQTTLENAQKTKSVLKSIKDLNIANLKLKTAGYRVTPQRNHKVRPPRIEGYEVSDTIAITLEGLSPERLSGYVSDIFEKALHSGANNIESVRFYIQDRESLENDALKQATQRAMVRAQTLATAAGVKLKRIVSLSTEPAQMRPQIDLLRAAEMGASAAPPIEIGESRVRVQVGIAYEIE